ncbi:MAG: hypothetical protein F4210_01925 [Holophagales bacterium]|nr:hypothetical protein [Holophagales bacterium]MYF94269.1 hypothetical protein [Holophagales bacterium]
MSASEKVESPAVHGDESAASRRGERLSPGFRRFIFGCVVLYYAFYAVGVFLISSERSSLEQSLLVLGFALLTVAYAGVGIAAWGLPGSGSLRHLTLLDRLDRVPDWLAYSVLFLGGALFFLAIIAGMPRVGMGEFFGPALPTGLGLFWLGYVCGPGPLVGRR